MATIGDPSDLAAQAIRDRIMAMMPAPMRERWDAEMHGLFAEIIETTARLGIADGRLIAAENIQRMMSGDSTHFQTATE